MNLPASLALLMVSLAMLFFGRGRNGRRSPDFPKMSLDSEPAVRHGDIVFVRCWLDGRRSKSELATLEIFCAANPKSARRLD
jgi:hypothetical protein